MQWNVGQSVVCDRPEQLLTGCQIIAKDGNSIIISCPSVGIVVTGEQQRLQELGWKPEDAKLENQHSLDLEV